MGRPREFVEAQVIAAARDAFWAGGVDGTAISDLTEATGLSAGSLYKAFGSKAGLFHRTLEDYLSQGRADVEATLDAGSSPLAGVEDWVLAQAERAGQDRPTSGCYAVVCTVEKAGTDPEARAILTAHGQAVQAMLAAALTRAAEAGETTADPQAAARMLLAAVNGIQVEARRGVTTDDARAALRLALDALR